MTRILHHLDEAEKAVADGSRTRTGRRNTAEQARSARMPSRQCTRQTGWREWYGLLALILLSFGLLNAPLRAQVLAAVSLGGLLTRQAL